MKSRGAYRSVLLVQFCGLLSRIDFTRFLETSYLPNGFCECISEKKTDTESYWLLENSLFFGGEVC